MTAPAHPVVFRPIIRAPSRGRTRGGGDRARLRPDARAAPADGHRPRRRGAPRRGFACASSKRAGEPDLEDAPASPRGRFDLARRPRLQRPRARRARRSASRRSTRSTTSSPIQQHNIGCRLARRVMTPDAIPPERLRALRRGAGEAASSTRGSRRSTTCRTSSPTRRVLEELGVDRRADRRRSCARRPTSRCTTASPTALFPQVLDHLGTPRGRHAIVIPRTEAQREHVRALGCRR